MVALNGNSGGVLLISGGPSNVGLPESTVFLLDYRVKFVERQFPQHWCKKPSLHLQMTV